VDEILKQHHITDAPHTQTPDRSHPPKKLDSPGVRFKILHPKEIAVGTHVIPDHISRRSWFGEADEPAVPLLILALYSHKFFDVPLAFIAEPGWRIRWIKRGHPQEGKYEVPEEKWGKFEEFARLVEKGLAELNLWSLGDAGFRNKFALAAERYFRASFAAVRFWMSTFILDDSVSDIDSFDTYDLWQKADEVGVGEEALLQYVLALETVLFNDNDEKERKLKSPGESQQTTKKFVSRLSAIVGRDTGERKRLKKIAEQVYNARSRITHGEEPESYPEFDVTRRLCQCALGILLLLASDAASQGIGEIVYNLSSTDESKRKEALCVGQFRARPIL
jgi:Apea-like HEPN